MAPNDAPKDSPKVRVSIRCVRCGKRTPTLEAGAINPAGRVCVDCWDSATELEAIEFGSRFMVPDGWKKVRATVRGGG